MSLHHVEQVMGTAISIDVVDSHDRALVDELVAWFHHVDEVFSPYKDLSPISKIGRGEVLPGDPLLTDEVVEVLERCETLLLETGGVFDVWDLPSPNGTRFDPCGYVKGWSLEKAAQILDGQGVRDYCINAGGDIALNGRNFDGEPWRIGVRHPDDAAALALLLQYGEGRLGIATSGSYERGAHIQDPRTHQPSTEMASVTVIGPSIAEADAYATTLYVMGVEGLAWLAEREGYCGCVITRDEQLYTTDRFDAYLVS
jgi:thiamine biosynthesis lipoprotein